MVELRGVSKRFGEFVAVDGVDLSIRAGEFLTLLGPSGCGKTTLLRMISGFERPTRGTVLLDGRDVTCLPPYRRDVNQVFQSYALFPHLNVWDNVAFGLRMKRVAQAELQRRVQEAIELVSLAGLEKRKPAELSGGQKQRVALARALVCEPKVLLLDEPLAALDAQLRRAMQIELKRLQSRLGITFVFVTHDQEEALVMSDRIGVVNRGRIEQVGPVSEIYHRPQTRFVADFLGAANILEMRAEDRGTAGMQLTHASAFSIPVAEHVSTAASTVLVCVRPEKIALSRDVHGELRDEMSGSSSTLAIVQEAIFRGTTTQVQLLTPEGMKLTAVVANQSGEADAFASGDEVIARIDPRDVVILGAPLIELADT